MVIARGKDILLHLDSKIIEDVKFAYQDVMLDLGEGIKRSELFYSFGEYKIMYVPELEIQKKPVLIAKFQDGGKGFFFPFAINRTLKRIKAKRDWKKANKEAGLRL